MKRAALFIVLTYIFTLSIGCIEYRSISSIDDIGADAFELSDTTLHTTDVCIDTEPKYVYIDTPFLQYESKLIDTHSAINSIIEYNGHILCGKEDGLFELLGDNLLRLNLYGFENIKKILNFKEWFILIKERGITLGDLNKILLEKNFEDPILYVAVTDNKIFIGFDSNNYALFEDDKFTEKKFDFKYTIRNMCTTKDYLYALTDEGVFKIDRKDYISEKIINGYFSSVECNYNQDKIFLSSDDGFAIYENGLLKKISKDKGAPYTKVKFVKETDKGIFAGSDKGLMLYKENGEWDYFHSRYYIPDWDINDVTITNSKDILVATKKGIGIIYSRRMTLADKEKILYEGMKKRHNRMGFYSPSGLKESGNLNSAFTHDDDNDGQWSGMYLAALCFKYAVTQNKSVLMDAKETLEALLLLETITGKDGFFARSVVEPELCDQKKQSGGEWHLSQDGKWCFKGDTSSDEYVGHVFGLSIYYDLCADENDKKRIAKIFGRLQRYIVLNGYIIEDLDGKVTTHGQFSPEWIRNVGIFGDAGLNSAMILGGLRFAYHITGDTFFEEHFYKLARDERYFDYIRRIEDINTAVQINHDSEEMSFLALFTLLRLEEDPKFKKYWFEGLENIYQTQIREKNPEFNMIYAFFNPEKDYHLEDSIRTLKEFYTHGIEWKVYNSHRADYTLDPKKDRFNRAQSLEVLPYNQKRAIRWAENPFVLDEEGEGTSEQILTPWLLPYWMGRYIGVIK